MLQRYRATKQTNKARGTSEEIGEPEVIRDCRKLKAL